MQTSDQIKLPENISVHELSRHIDWSPCIKEPFASPRFQFQCLVKGPEEEMTTPYSGGILAFLDDKAKASIRQGGLIGKGNPYTASHFAAHFIGSNPRRYKVDPSGNGCTVARGYGIILQYSKINPVDVIYSLYRDCDALAYSRYEEWAFDFGYDPDSREGEKTFRLCQELGAEFRRIMGHENFAAFEELFSDY